MAKTIEQLQRAIASEKNKIAKETKLSEAITERQKLSRDLFKLKQRKLTSAGAKAKRLSKRFGKALLKVGKKVAPVVKKQARLIRDQQLRDNKIASARAKRKPKARKKARKSSNQGVFGNLDF